MNFYTCWHGFNTCCKLNEWPIHVNLAMREITVNPLFSMNKKWCLSSAYLSYVQWRSMLENGTRKRGKFWGVLSSFFAIPCYARNVCLVLLEGLKMWGARERGGERRQKMEKERVRSCWWMNLVHIKWCNELLLEVWYERLFGSLITIDRVT